MATPTSRIRRPDALPHDWPSKPRRAPRVLSVNTQGEALLVRCWQSRWAAFEVGDGAVKRRNTLAEIVSDGDVVGGFQLCDFHADTFTSSALFLEALDSGSQATFAVGETICAHWEYVEDLTGYGDILELHRAWVAPARSKPGRLAKAISTVVGTLHPAHAIMILKAFPLEYEGTVTAANELAFKRRQAALMRYYAASLGMHVFAQATGRDGWMYAVPERLRRIEGLTPA
jgi:hypothetical protein